MQGAGGQPGEGGIWGAVKTHFTWRCLSFYLGCAALGLVIGYSASDDPPAPAKVQPVQPAPKPEDEDFELVIQGFDKVVIKPNGEVFLPLGDEP